MHSPSTGALQRSSFSTARRMLKDAEQPSLGKFNLKGLGATRTTRTVLVLGLLTVGFVEGIGWLKL
jgi:hypothetical protein